MKKTHVLCRGTARFAISLWMQVLICVLGQSKVYSEASELLKSILDVDLSAMQIQRVCVHYGKVVDSLTEVNCETVIPKLETQKKDAKTYVMVDGSQIKMREKEKWREMKLGRIFYDNQVVDIQKDRREIMESIYVSHMGNSKDFTTKLEYHLLPYKNMVFIADGAQWQWNWVEDNYPGSIQILDFFHAKEKLVLLAKYQIQDDEQRSKWVKRQLGKLKDNGVLQIIDTVKHLRPKNDAAKEAKKTLITYYEKHEDRMQYKTYKEKGLLIGSGPIEAAHRSVIQQRMKLSGQKWSEEGAQAIAALRCLKKSDAWDRVEKIVAAA